MTTTRTPAKPIPTTKVFTAYGLIDMHAEIISDDFAINPALATDEATGVTGLGGGFAITHRHTGYAMPGPQTCIDCARAAAKALAAISGVDWSTLTPTDTAAFAATIRPDIRVEIRDALAIVEFCDQEMCPQPGINWPSDAPATDAA